MTTKIYTKTGDKGMTSLVSGTRVPKSDLRLEAYGTVDELMAHIGHLHDKIKAASHPDDCSHAESLIKSLVVAIEKLMTVSALLAAEESTTKKLPQITENDIANLETDMDRLLYQLPSLNNFTLPIGSQIVSYIHICRTVCRRAERCIIRSAEVGNDMPGEIISYINRLSDYFYALARRLAHELKAEEVIWKPGNVK